MKKHNYTPTKEEKEQLKLLLKRFKESKIAQKENPQCMCWACQVGSFEEIK